jgi:tetratricopeptide (TPR) repeat protein
MVFEALALSTTGTHRGQGKNENWVSRVEGDSKMKLFLPIWFLCGVSSGLALAQSSNQPPDLNFAVGEQFYATKNYLQALQNYQQALVTDSKSPLVYERMGDCYEALNQDDKALNAFKWAHYYDPQNKRLAQKLSDLSSGVVSSTSSDSFFVPHSPPIKGLSLSLSPLVSIPLGGNTANQFNMGWGGPARFELRTQSPPHGRVGSGFPGLLGR